MNSADGANARESATGSHDDARPDRIAKDSVGRTNVALAFRGDGRGFEPDVVSLQRVCGIEHHEVIGCAPVWKRKIVTFELELQSSHGWIEYAQCFDQQLLSGLIALEDDQRRRRQNELPL